MGMFVLLVLMRRVFMLMAAMLPAVLMVMHMGIADMGVLMRMFVEMLVLMGVFMLMAMNHLLVNMLMTVGVRVPVGVQMLVSVLTFHGLNLPVKKASLPGAIGLI